MCKELVSSRVLLTDMSYRNVMCAPKTPPGRIHLSTSLPNRGYEYRFIDLEDAVKFETPVERVQSMYEGAIEMIMDELAQVRRIDSRQ